MRVFLVANLAASLMLIAPAHAGDGDRKTELQSPAGRVLEAGPGDLVMDIKITTALPNVFGGADIFGRRKDVGRVLIQYNGMKDAHAIFVRRNIIIDSNDSTVTRHGESVPIFEQNYVTGTVNGQFYSGTVTRQGRVDVPVPLRSQAIDGGSLQIAVPIGGRLKAEGRVLTVRKTEGGSIQYSVQ